MGEKKPAKVRNGGVSAKGYSGVVLIVTVFVRSKGRKVGKDKMARVR